LRGAHQESCVAPRIRKHVIVPEADDAIAACLEPARTLLTVIRMLSAIDLDDELRLGAKKSTM
jgi:hypothetical protein